ncbi:hypothetical protein HIM_04573 [Hirsutella minnesotensis 3608]|uniref:Non-homologous end-joining factor 1 n=1 Tax=Hirsutella minnesotensis 3608 TaxID=1043627 RepID=A0A0F8A1D1_9HYPO|nr:hypothetical protein HIM_04573 [Hirsutella minnesotensis 3608]
MSSSEPTWRPLPLAPSSRHPVLLVAAQVDTASYTVRVTDMANMWAETLDRKSICMRGWNENTSIDPSDTPENMARFLASLTSALDASQPGHSDTSLVLTRAAASDAGQDGLTLRVTCALPGLAALEWPIHLRKCPPSSIATQLVLPLIQAHHVRKREVESLLQALAQKDSVLTKLSDKFEAMGVGLEHVFTALSGRKKVTRSAANDKVKGLAPFDQHKWRTGMSHDMNGPNNTSDLFQSVFGDFSLRYGSMMDTEDSPALDMWWHDFNGTLPVGPRTQTRPTPPSGSTTSPPIVPATAGEDDDDFQVQATPPRLRSSDARPDTAGGGRSVARDPTLTDDDDEPSLILDSNPPPAVSATVRSVAKESLPPSRLGTIGGGGGSRHVAPSPPVVSENVATIERIGQAVDDSETASEASNDGDDATASVSEPTSPPRPVMEPTMSKSKGGLGRIGGGSAKRTDTIASTPPEADSEEHRATAPPKRLGVIGSRTGSKPASSMPAQENNRGRPSTRDEAIASPAATRETSQERADRRREALKRDLEMKAAAAPAKKKRRF